MGPQGPALLFNKEKDMSVKVVLTSALSTDFKYRYRLPNGVTTSITVPFKGVLPYTFSSEAELDCFKKQTLDYTTGPNPQLRISDKAEVAQARRSNEAIKKERAEIIEEAIRNEGSIEQSAEEKGLIIEATVEKVDAPKTSKGKRA